MSDHKVKVVQGENGLAMVKWQQFQKDIASAHTARKVKPRMEDNEINLMPARSTDLNPII